MSGLAVYRDATLGVHFEIDDSFAPGPRREWPAGMPGDVRSACLVASGSGGEQAVLSISRVAAGSDTSPQEVADHLLIHNRYAAHTAEQNGWTIHSPWKAALLAGYPAMHCDYVAPGPAAASGVPAATSAMPTAPLPADFGPAAPVAADALPTAPPYCGAPPDSPLAAPGQSASAGHVQAWIAYAGRQTFQLMLVVDPPGDLARNRALMDTVVRTFEIGEPPADDSGGENVPRAQPAPVEPD